jgi:hypothetical protein
MSVSFLVGVNTFIITSLTKSSNVELFTQSAIVFAISIILLLFSAFKITDASGVATSAVSLSPCRCKEHELLIRDKGVRNLSTNSFLL